MFGDRDSRLKKNYNVLKVTKILYWTSTKSIIIFNYGCFRKARKLDELKINSRASMLRLTDDNVRFEIAS